MAGTTDRLVRLDELDDFKVADGDPDVRGWDVLGIDNRKVGEVDGLLVDTEAMKVRYLDVDIDGAPAGHNGHILIPIGYARILEKDKRVQVDRLKSVDLVALPAYSRQSLTRDYETDLQGRFAGTGGTAPPAGDFYAHESYDDSRFFGRNTPGRGPIASPDRRE